MGAPVAEINLNALHHNFARVRELAPESKILVMMKANAYGHGLLRVAQALEEADALAVARVDEAMILRQAGIKRPLVVMTGFVNNEELETLIEHDIQPVIHSEYQLDYLDATLKKPLSVWFKVETGLGRLGFPAEQALGAYERLMANEKIKKPIVSLSHLASADDTLNPKTLLQLTRFHQMTESFQGQRSIARSAAIMSNPHSHLDWVRPGIMIYGASPFANEVGSDRGLKSVMTMRSRLISVKSIPAGETVGYGELWKCEENMPVGVVAFGYADGYPRHTQQGAPVLINGVRCPLIGRVSMDMFMVDLRDCPHAKVGDEVTLWGEELPIEILARYANTIPYTIWVNITPRVKFVEKSF